MRLIDADALKEALSNNEAIRIFNLHYDGLIAELIDNAPTVTPDEIQALLSDYLVYRVEPQRPQGEWIIIDKDHISFRFKICSNCGKEAEWLDGGSQFLSKFCPNCGAKMGGGAE